MSLIKYLYTYVCILLSFKAVCQENKNNTFSDQSIEYIDPKYREDQFYLGFTFDFLLNKPDNFRTIGFSGGFQSGFIRDIPLNKKRNWAIGSGVGYAYSMVGHNYDLSKKNLISYIEGQDIEQNRSNIHSIELPIQLRWRTSTPTTTKFYRLYLGGRFSYVFNQSYKYEIDQIKRKFQSNQIRKTSFILDISYGWHRANIYFSYNLNTLFHKDIQTELTEIPNILSCKVGLMFYIL